MRFEEVSLHAVDGSEVTRVPSELLWNGKILAALWRFCSFFNFADSHIWKLKLGHLSLELKLIFPVKKVKSGSNHWEVVGYPFLHILNKS